jgi:hypothetical protein
MDARRPGLVFDFSVIPACFYEGDVVVDAHNAHPVEYHDLELTELDLALPRGATGAWSGPERKKHYCETFWSPQGALAQFTVYRWTRGAGEAGEELEYWLSDGDAFDYLSVLRRGDWFLAVGLFGGHPNVVTPAVDWYSAGGSASASPLPCETADGLIEAMVETAELFVAHQAH